jgi:hypothetical protein
MIAITKAAIPDYLRFGSLFETLGGDGGPFELPAEMCKLDLKLVNDGDLHHLCSTSRLWAVEMPIMH